MMVQMTTVWNVVNVYAYVHEISMYG